MPLIKLYMAPALLLLLALTCPPGGSLPLMTRRLLADSCVPSARTLLHNITAALAQNNLFSGIDCWKQNVELNTESSTAVVCTPTDSKCSGGNTRQFDQDSCDREIRKDLGHYYKVLSSQPDPNGFLAASVLPSLGDFMRSCWSPPLEFSTTEAAVGRASSYDERLSLCKVLRGFQVRAVTINRALGLIASGEHKK